MSDSASDVGLGEVPSEIAARAMLSERVSRISLFKRSTNFLSHASLVSKQEPRSARVMLRGLGGEASLSAESCAQTFLQFCENTPSRG